MRPLIIIQFFIVMFLTHTAFANPDSGLYDPLPPEGASFIRFINLNDQSTESRAGKANGKSYKFLAYKEASSYFVMKDMSVKSHFGTAAHDFEIEPQKFYTLALLPDDKTILVLEDEANTNRAKAQIQVYNMSAYDMISLKAKGGSIDIVKDIEQAKSDTRQINPLKIDLSIFNGEDQVFDAGTQTLERGESYSLFVVGKDDAIWVQSRTDTTK